MHGLRRRIPEKASARRAAVSAAVNAAASAETGGNVMPVAVAPRRVAIAGATGFVGRSLVPALAEQHEVIALGRGVAPR